MSYLDPLVIAKLGNLKIKANYIVEGFMSGMHRTKLLGYSQEFREHRQYSKGDEIKFIDWKVYGRLDKFFVKRFQSESNLKAYILLDSSGSMAFTSNTISKLEYGKKLTATISYLLIRQSDSVGLVSFDTKIREIIPPRSNRQHLSVIIETLKNISAGEDTDIAKTINELSNFLKKRALIVLISDLFDKQESVINSLKNLQARHQEIVILHTLDPAECDFPYSGEITLELIEPPFTKYNLQAEETSQLYKQYFNLFCEEYKSNFQKVGISYNLVRTNTPIERVILSTFKTQ